MPTEYTLEMNEFKSAWTDDKDIEIRYYNNGKVVVRHYNNADASCDEEVICYGDYTYLN